MTDFEQLKEEYLLKRYGKLPPEFMEDELRKIKEACEILEMWESILKTLNKYPHHNRFQIVNSLARTEIPYWQNRIEILMEE